ncbi:hypothetical protein Lal_00006033 [Lupinus albus]|nr:hypothetical protein Lal_00006033 [Lupinus albus]
MARRANFIEEINSSKDTWKLKVQLRGTIMKAKELKEISAYIYHFTTFEDISNDIAAIDVL